MEANNTIGAHKMIFNCMERDAVMLLNASYSLAGSSQITTTITVNNECKCFQLAASNRNTPRGYLFVRIVAS